MNRVRWISAALFLTGNLYAQMPVKLAVDAPGPVIEPRPAVECTLRLLDERNRPVKAPKDLIVRIIIYTGSQVAAGQSLTLLAGDDAEKFPVPLPASGLVRVLATHRELLDGEAAFRVQPLPVTEMPLQLFLWYTPRGRRLLADGIDAARISAGLNAPAPAEVRLQFRESTGPRSVVIPAGQTGAQFTLTSQRAGPLGVQYVGAQLPVECRDTTLMEVGFLRPLRRMQLQPVPATVPLGRAVAFHVQLRDVYDQPCAAGEVRHAQLFVTQGHGHLKPAGLRFGTDASQATAVLYPWWPGQITIGAQSLRLNDAVTTVQVSWPTGWLGASAAGGLIGSFLAGWFARRRRRDMERHRNNDVLVTLGDSVVGLVSGVVVFALGVVVTMAGHAGLTRFIAPDFVANGPMALLLGLLGGWVVLKILHHHRE